MNKLQIAINEESATRLRLDISRSDAYEAKKKYVANETTENFEMVKEAWKIVHELEESYYMAKNRLEAQKLIAKYKTAQKNNLTDK